MINSTLKSKSVVLNLSLCMHMESFGKNTDVHPQRLRDRVGFGVEARPL